MKLYLLILTLIGGTILPQVSMALSGSSYNIGGTKYYSFSDGTTGSSFDIAGTRYYSFSDGTRGTAYDIAGSTYYSFTESVSGYSFNLGRGNEREYYGQIRLDMSNLLAVNTEMLSDYCKGINPTLYPDYSTRSNLLGAECIQTMCPQNGCDPYNYAANITSCVETGRASAYKEIRDICINEKAKKYIDLVNSAAVLTISAKNPTATSVITIIDAGLVKKLKGHILLQVESRGEAWYVNPKDGKRYYTKDGATAYQMMRSFGLGITDADLGKIPAVDNEPAMNDSTSVCSTNSTANRVKGKILLQVQQRGEAWYVHPDKCRRIYMKDGGVAHQIMRLLSLGITNTDLSKIPEGSL